MKNILIIALILFQIALFGQNRNYIIIMADDLAYGDIGIHNDSVSTPEIDAFVTVDGAVDVEKYYTNPTCSPSRASFLTGLIPDRVGMQQVGPTFDAKLLPNYLTIASMLKKKGYRTAFFGKWHLEDEAGKNPSAFGYDTHYAATVESGKVRSAMWYWQNKIEAFLDTVSGPYLLVFQPFEPHYVITGTAEFTDPSLSLVASADTFRNRYNGVTYPSSRAPKRYGYSRSPAVSSQYVYYGACLSELSKAIGNVIGKLKAKGTYATDFVAITSDNGGAQAAECLPQNYKKVGNDSLMLSGNKARIYEGGVRVPFLVRCAGLGIQNTTPVAPVCVYDFLPTIAVLEGITDPRARQTDGENMVDILKGTQTERKRGIYVQGLVGSARLNNPAVTDLPPEGGTWSNGRQSEARKPVWAYINKTGTKKIVGGFHPYPGTSDDPSRYLRREKFDPTMTQFYSLNEADAHPQNESIDMFTTATGSDLTEFQTMLREAKKIFQNMTTSMPYRNWNSKESNM